MSLLDSVDLNRMDNLSFIRVISLSLSCICEGYGQFIRSISMFCHVAHKSIASSGRISVMPFFARSSMVLWDIPVVMLFPQKCFQGQITSKFEGGSFMWITVIRPETISC
jgi:hypothetical protein